MIMTEEYLQEELMEFELIAKREARQILSERNDIEIDENDVLILASSMVDFYEKQVRNLYVIVKDQ